MSLILVDKPEGPSSNAFLTRVKRFLGVKKAGFAGTLDPFASGLLIIGVEQETKKLSSVALEDKEYLFSIEFGTSTNTFDSKGDITDKNNKIPSFAEINQTLTSFCGKILQKPPVFSAIKINGKRSYSLARKGIAVDISPREVTIHKIALCAQVSEKTFSFYAHCSKGTYIRSLAIDIAATLNCIAFVKNLRRIAIGSYRVENSLNAKNPDYFTPSSQ